jgi:hypothetical protein
MKHFGALLLCCCAACFAQSDLNAERAQKLREVHSVFVDGNNVGALKVREEIEKGKTCLALVLKPSDADAIVAVGTESQMQDHFLGVRDYVVSGTLTNKAGELLWASEVRFSDAPFSNGGKEAGKILVKILKRQACDGKTR